MGKKKAPAPQIVYAPPPPPPPPPTTVPTQSLSSQIALNETSSAQQRLNMELGAQLDRTNSEFMAGQDIRRTQATGAEQRLTYATQGEQERASTAAQGKQYRLGLTHNNALAMQLQVSKNVKLKLKDLLGKQGC